MRVCKLFCADSHNRKHEGLVIVQESTVLDIFMDMLALEFVENVDDIIHELCKRGFFGKKLRTSTNRTFSYEPPGSEVKDKNGRMARFSVWCRRIIRIIYFMNMIVMLAMLLYVNLTQNVGNYRCKSLSVTFGGESLLERMFPSLIRRGDSLIVNLNSRRGVGRSMGDEGWRGT